jgi:hypothetical protein
MGSTASAGDRVPAGFRECDANGQAGLSTTEYLQAFAVLERHWSTQELGAANRKKPRSELRVGSRIPLDVTLDAFTVAWDKPNFRLLPAAGRYPRFCLPLLL